jgi:hypothetical protein
MSLIFESFQYRAANSPGEISASSCEPPLKLLIGELRPGAQLAQHSQCFIGEAQAGLR